MEPGRDPAPIGLVDLAALRAAKVWGSSPTDRFWNLFPPQHRCKLLEAWHELQRESAESARESLRCEHQAQARPDLGRVHPSWWARALQDEPRSVRLAVATHLPGELSGALAVENRLDPNSRRPDFPPQPFALRAVLSLWTERLIGDLPNRPDDPPVVAALTLLNAGEIARMIRAVGLAKRSLSAIRSGDNPDRLKRLREKLGDLDPRAVLIAQRDSQTVEGVGARSDSRLGLLTFARLLRLADPYRTRWALQHIPYPTARSIRKLMDREPPRTPVLARWETQFLRAGWLELKDSGRIVEPWIWEAGP